MSHWDFGRPTDGEHDAPRPSRAAGAAYPPDLPYRQDVPEMLDLPDLPPGAANGLWAARDTRPWQDTPPREDPWPAQGPWSGQGPQPPADEGWPAREAWPAAGGGEGDGWSGDGWDDDETATAYPLTYERDDYASADPRPAEAARAPWAPWPPAPYPGAGDADTNILTRDDADEQADWLTGGAGGGPRASQAAGRRWLIPAGVAVAAAAAGAAAVLLTGGRPAASSQGGGGGFVAPSATPSTRASTGPASTGPASTGPASTGPASTGPASTGPASTGPAGTATPPATGPLTMTQAKSVLAGYTTANNSANAQRSDAALATVETGSSDAIDAGLYRQQQAAGTAPYPAFGPAQATYYIPRGEPADGPKWFVVQVANAFTANPQKVTANEYLLFTQSAAGGAWQDAIEPYLLRGANAPQIKIGADGLADAVSPDAAAYAVTPSQLPAETAASLDGTGSGQNGVADPGNLADLADQKLWRGKVPGGSVTDAHTAATGSDGQEFALRTADGGALVFYTDAAEVTITPPAGSALHLTVPGFYSPGQALSRATVSYLEQFAAYDPPSGGAAPGIVADYSGITGKN